MASGASDYFAWPILFLAFDTRRRLYVNFGHGPGQATDIVLKKPVFTLELVVVRFDLVYPFR